MLRLALALSVGLTLALAAPAAALDRYMPMRVPPGPGPAKYDRVFVQQLGPAGADNVLVLVPGTNGGAGSITPVARDIVRRVPRTQVWIVDRREQAFEDRSGLGWDQLIPEVPSAGCTCDPFKGDARPDADTRFGVLTDRPFPV